MFLLKTKQLLVVLSNKGMEEISYQSDSWRRKVQTRQLRPGYGLHNSNAHVLFCVFFFWQLHWNSSKQGVYSCALFLVVCWERSWSRPRIMNIHNRWIVLFFSPAANWLERVCSDNCRDFATTRSTCFPFAGKVWLLLRATILYAGFNLACHSTFSISLNHAN